MFVCSGHKPFQIRREKNTQRREKPEIEKLPLLSFFSHTACTSLLLLHKQNTDWTSRRSLSRNRCCGMPTLRNAEIAFDELPFVFICRGRDGWMIRSGMAARSSEIRSGSIEKRRKKRKWGISFWNPTFFFFLQRFCFLHHHQFVALIPINDFLYSSFPSPLSVALFFSILFLSFFSFLVSDLSSFCLSSFVYPNLPICRESQVKKVEDKGRKSEICFFRLPPVALLAVG